jgi:hypothetical protein
MMTAASLEREVLLLQRALHIIDCDLVAVAEHVNALVASDIDAHVSASAAAQALSKRSIPSVRASR